jgi:hypothetical protein
LTPSQINFFNKSLFCNILLFFLWTVVMEMF